MKQLRNLAHFSRLTQTARSVETATHTTRTIKLRLNNFDEATLPESLLGANREPLKEINIELKELFHQYFLAKYGQCVEDSGHYEFERCLTAGPDWRFRRDGIGADKEAKRNASNELGKGFARWFHYRHLGFTYFRPLEELLGRDQVGFVWVRSSKGDLPDYVCGPDESKVNLLEAKGRYSSVTFDTTLAKPGFAPPVSTAAPRSWPTPWPKNFRKSTTAIW